jgi:hypothetical protein
VPFSISDPLFVPDPRVSPTLWKFSSLPVYARLYCSRFAMRPDTVTRWASPMSFATSVERISSTQSCPEENVRVAVESFTSPIEIRRNRVKRRPAV